MLDLIKDVLETDVQQGHPDYGWVPAIPLDRGWRDRIRDAWAVFTRKAEAVRWPHHVS